MARVTSARKVNTEFSDVKAWFDGHMALDKIDLDDQSVYEYAYHAGRWCGIFQCVDETSMISMSDRSLKRIDEIVVGDSVKTFDETQKCFVDSIVENVIDQGIKKCLEFTFENGETLTCTADHLVLTQRGWVPAIDLKPEDDIECFSEPKM